MAKNQTYKAFTARPSHVMDLNGVLLDSAPLMVELATEVRDLSAYATYVVRNDVALGDKLAKVTATQPAVAGQRAGVTMPEFLVPDKKDENGNTLTDKKTGAPAKIKTGKSRKERMFRHRVVTK